MHRSKNGWRLSEESRLKQSKSMKKYNLLVGKNILPNNPINKICEYCNNEYQTFKIKQRFCSVVCSCKFRSREARKGKENLNTYRRDASFKFNLKDYPDKFNFGLIEKHGWYSAANRDNNLNGISRDHMVSVKYGFENNIDPKIIGHPANCKLMQHSKNSSKHSECSITLEDLMERIENWNN